MDLIAAPEPRVPRFLRGRNALRWWLVPVAVLGFLFAVKPSSPDGAPPQPLDSFLTSLHSLDAERAGKVRVLHFGDSHIASDNETSFVRSYLQSRFGDGGAGLWLPWGGPRLSTQEVLYGNTYGWQRWHPSYSSPVEDTGLSLSYIQAESPGQNVWLEAAGSEFRVDYLAQPQGGAAEFLLDGAFLGQRSMSAAYSHVETATFTAPGGDALHRFEIHTLDSGPVRILGVSVEKSTPGLVYSSLGLIGARAEYLLKCRAETFEAQIAAEQPDLIVLGYGTNETSGSYLDRSAYEGALAAIIGRIRNAAPRALVVLLTPPDRGNIYPGQEERIERILQEVIAAERDVAWREGAILMDLHTAMGGAGSAERWASMRPALARPDMIHFTNDGYNLLGRYIAGGIMQLYNSGGNAEAAVLPSAVEGEGRPGEILPTLYSGLSGGAGVPASSREGYASESASAPTQIYYFLQSDGQVVVTNDLTTVDFDHGRLISGAQARCLLRGNGRPCDNAARW
jgi:lysophospholipase L1-like esterase